LGDAIVAQYFWTAESYALEANASDAWDVPSGTVTREIKQDGEGKYLEVLFNADTAFLRFLPPGSSVGDCNIYLKCRVDDDGNSWAFEVIRARAASGDLLGTHTYCIWRNNNGGRVGLGATSGGSNEGEVQLDQAHNSGDSRYVGPSNAHVYFEHRLSGTSQQVFVWSDTVAEPGTAQLSRTTALTAAGAIGMHAWFESNRLRVYEFGVGTGGDAAPREALASAPVLSSPSVTSITQVGATVNYSTDTAGTAYIYKSTSATPPSTADLKAGTGAVYATSASVSTGANSFTTSGGSADTLYYYYIILNDGTDDSNVLSGSFTTAAAASGPTIHTGTFVSATTGGYSLRFTTNRGAGTAYYVVYPVGSTDPTAVQIVAGTDGTDTAAITADSMTIGTSGVNTFPAITGLSPNTTYRNAIVHYALPE